MCANYLNQCLLWEGTIVRGAYFLANTPLVVCDTFFVPAYLLFVKYELSYSPPLVKSGDASTMPECLSCSCDKFAIPSMWFVNP